MESRRDDVDRTSSDNASGKAVKKVPFRHLVTYLMILTALVMIFYSNSFRSFAWSERLLSNKENRQRPDANLVDRCRIPETIYGRPDSGSFVNMTELVTWSEKICNRTKNVEPLEMLKVCNNGSSPELVSNRHVSRPDSETGQVYRVPNIVHYVYGYPLANKPMTFLMYISFLSVQRFLRPRYIFIHGDALPQGEWWNRTKSDVDNIYFNNLTSRMPSHVFGKPLVKPEHGSDIVRMDVLYKVGGMYFDLDVIVLRSFDGLRNFQFTLGHEGPNATPNLIMVSQPCPEFLLHWLNTYRDFDPGEWAAHSVYVPYSIGSKSFPHLVHFEPDTLVRPWYGDFGPQFGIGRLYDWSRQYSTHVWKRDRADVPSSPEDIKRLNSTVGEMMRHVYFGTKNFVAV